MRAHRGKFFALAAIAVVAVVALSLFAGGGAKSPGAALAEAADKAHAESMRFNFDMRIWGTRQNFKWRGTGVSTADGSNGTFGGVVTEDGQPLRMHGVARGDELWIAMPKLAPLLPPGKHWVHMVDSASAPRTLTPSEFMDFMKNASGVRKAGTTRVKGRETSHYEGKVDLNAIAAKVGGETDRRFKRVFGDQPHPLPIEAWVAEDTGLPSRVLVTSSAGEAALTLDIRILDYGVRVNAARPADRTVIEEKEFDRLTKPTGPAGSSAKQA